MSDTVDLGLLADVGQFLYKEARLQDQNAYAQWESLWTDDGVYWIPANGDDLNPDTTMSILYDNRSRISLRVKQLLTGKRHSQSPPSRLVRVLSNIEISKVDGDDISVYSNVVLYESNSRGETVWAARNEHVLRKTEAGLRMARKKVMLVNNDKALYTLAFLF
jgi:3-phenylpropionate/cinnamic acid dioxygenase small subunit